MSPRVLVVEDNEDNRALVVKVLGRRGYEVVEAAGEDEAVAAARATPPDLVLMDVNLAGASGFEVARRLKAEPGFGGVPVVALTAYAMVGDRERALASGCDGYLAKPIDVRRLPDQVAAYLRGERP